MFKVAICRKKEELELLLNGIGSARRSWLRSATTFLVSIIIIFMIINIFCAIIFVVSLFTRQPFPRFDSALSRSLLSEMRSISSWKIIYGMAIILALILLVVCSYTIALLKFKLFEFHFGLVSWTNNSNNKFEIENWTSFSCWPSSFFSFFVNEWKNFSRTLKRWLHKQNNEKRNESRKIYSISRFSNYGRIFTKKMYVMLEESRFY